MEEKEGTKEIKWVVDHDARFGYYDERSSMQTESKVSTATALEMAEAGVLFGHMKSETHPRTKPYIAAMRNEVELFDPQATLDSIEKAKEFLEKTIEDGKMVLFVGTLVPAKERIMQIAQSYGMPYVVSRWIGGTLTNFAAITDRVRRYQELKEKNEKGELKKYTKKEQLDFRKEIGKLSKIFGGLTTLTRMPDVVFIVDITEHEIAVREARQKNIPVVAFVDTDADPNLVDYPVFASDHSTRSIAWVLDKLFATIKKTK